MKRVLIMPKLDGWIRNQWNYFITDYELGLPLENWCMTIPGAKDANLQIITYEKRTKFY